MRFGTIFLHGFIIFGCSFLCVHYTRVYECNYNDCKRYIFRMLYILECITFTGISTVRISTDCRFRMNIIFNFCDWLCTWFIRFALIFTHIIKIDYNLTYVEHKIQYEDEAKTQRNLFWIWDLCVMCAQKKRYDHIIK